MKSNVSNGSKAALMSALLSGGLYLASALTVSPTGLDRIKVHEGVRLAPYKDQAGVLTVCYGSTKDVHPNRQYSQAECTARLKDDVDTHSAIVGRYVAVPLTQGQYDALSDFAFQYGESKFKSSTLLRKLNAWDCRGAAAEFPRWSKVAGVHNKGVYNRSLRNQKLFSDGCAIWEDYGL